MRSDADVAQAGAGELRDRATGGHAALDIGELDRAGWPADEDDVVRGAPAVTSAKAPAKEATTEATFSSESS